LEHACQLEKIEWYYKPPGEVPVIFGGSDLLYEFRRLKARKKRSDVDGVGPPERVNCWRRECCWVYIEFGENSGDQWVKETASEVLAEVMTKSRMWYLSWVGKLTC